jgi:metal-responsive CopG/Arc/MetJ family transcriptional regulator
MAKIQIAIRVDEEILKIIDGLADEQGQTRTDVIAGMLERGIDEERSFVDDTKIPMLHALIEKMYDAGVAGPIYKLMGMEVDKRRIEISKRLRAGRGKGSGIPKVKGAGS